MLLNAEYNNVARVCNDLIDAEPDLQDLVLVAYAIEKATKKFNASDRAGLSAMLVKLATRLDKDACVYQVQH